MQQSNKFNTNANANAHKFGQKSAQTRNSAGTTRSSGNRGYKGKRFEINKRSYPPASVRFAEEIEILNSDPISLMLPRVDVHFDPRVIWNTALSTYGTIKLIDLALSFDTKTNAPYFRCFIHYSNWLIGPRFPDSTRELCNIRNPNKRVFYPYGIGAVVENTSVDRFLTLSGFDSYHTAEIDAAFEKFWDDYEAPRILKELEAAERLKIKAEEQDQRNMFSLQCELDNEMQWDEISDWWFPPSTPESSPPASAVESVFTEEDYHEAVGNNDAIDAFAPEWADSGNDCVDMNFLSAETERFHNTADSYHA